MHYSTITITLFLTLSSLSSTSAHGRNLPAHRRHHIRAASYQPKRHEVLIKAKRDEGEYDAVVTVTKEPDCDGEGSDGGCTEGAWQCSGQELQQCSHSSWTTMATCSGQTVCSASQYSTGCVYAWNLTNGTTASSIVPAGLATPTTITTNSTQVVGDDDDCWDDGEDVNDEVEDSAHCGKDEDEPEMTTSQGSSASIPTAPSPSASQPQIGAGLWAGDQGWYSKGGKHHKSSSADDWSSPSSSTDERSSPSSTTNDWSSPSSTTDGWSASSSSTDWYGATPSVTDLTSAGESISSASSRGKAKGRHSSTSSSAVAAPTGGSGGASGSFSAPHYVIYADYWLNKMPTASDIGSYNRFILAFWMASGRGAVDNAQAWEMFDASYRQEVIDEYHNAGVALMVSAFGSTDSPTSNGVDPVECAQDLAAWVKKYGMDGVDIDYEDMSAMNTNQAEDWLIPFQNELRRQLPAPYLISHAPVAPWFTSANAYAQKAYVKVQEDCGDGIDFYNVQFYNQGDGVYTDCDSLINSSGGAWPSTSVMEIHSYAGVPLHKIVIGKPLDSGDAANGYVDAGDLAQCVLQAQQQGWNGGVMFWEWADHAPSLMATVRAGR